MMAEPSPDPITSALRDAFRAVMGAYERWHRGEGEPTVPFDRKSVPISTICDCVSRFEERMPDDLWDILIAVTRRVDGLPNDQSYRSAAQHFARLIKEKKERHDRRDREEEGR
jgi:hypothetical protein